MFSLKITKVFGCVECLNGLNIVYKCTSSISRTNSFVICENDIYFSVICDTNGHKNTLNISLHQLKGKENALNLNYNYKCDKNKPILIVG